MAPDEDAEDAEVAERADDPALARRVAGARPDGDRLTRAVWFARVAGALFGDAPPVTVGRYRLERQLGRGGGGSVFVAHDPELHRDVAIKLIRCASERHRGRALDEARALARLSHPNVVPVHDVGETAEHVYLVMELLRGESLRGYAAGDDRRVRDVVAAYRQAAAGLAAAHAVGLVHRDFKPDNAVFGDDGRLRVVDFGLAVGEADAAGPAGTPRYMAPEQHAGAAIDATVDQYAVGVSLREAVTEGGRAEPAWLGRVIARAMAARPGDRFPSMEALARALGRDPRTLWSRRALIAAPVVLAALGFAIGRTASMDPGEACGGGAEALAPAWTTERAAAIAARLERLGTPFAAAAAPQVLERARGHGEAWLGAHRASCVARERGALSSELHDRAAVCLARSRAGLGEAMRLLETADAAELDEAIAALAGAGGAERCADPIELAAEAGALATPELRAIDQQIEVAAVNARAATARAVALAEEAAGAARRIDDPRLLARALLVLGHAHMAGELARAIPPLHEAMRLALANGQDELMAEAWARHAFARAHAGAVERQRVLDGLELVEIIGERARERGAFARALLANNAGSVAVLAGDFARGRERFRRAATEAKAVRGPGTVELATAVSNLAMFTADPGERARLFAEALAGVTAAVGPDHPAALWKQLQAIAEREDPRAVVAELAALCPRAARLHPALTQLTDVCAFELAWQAFAIGRGAHAREAARLLQPGERPPAQRLVQVYARLADGAATEALLAELEALAEAEAEKVGALGWYQHVYAANAALAVAAAARSLGDGERAERAAARAIEHLERVRATTGATGGVVGRRLAWARALRSSGQ